MGTRFLIAFLLTMAALWAQPDKTAWDLLNKGMLDKSVEKRRLAISAVASVGLDLEAVRLLELALHDQDASIRQMAVAGFGGIKTTTYNPSLKTAPHDSHKGVAVLASTTLSGVGGWRGGASFVDI